MFWLDRRLAREQGLPEDITPYGVDLLLFALEFEFARFLLPVLKAGLFRINPHLSRRCQFKKLE